jgi:hypothetical protein
VVDYPDAADDHRGVGIQIASPAGWYLPGHPVLAWTRSRPACSARFAVVQVVDAEAWLEQNHTRVTGMRELAYYDHPILGRKRGSVVVARFRRPSFVPGAVFYVLGRQRPCR